MEPVLVLNKPQGMTPLAAIQHHIKLHPEYAGIKLGAAGRLDPMADGLLLVLVGDENKKRKEYEVLPKTYEISVLFGFSTDSFDLLGLVTNTGNPTVTKNFVVNALNQFPKTYSQPYPPYSSKPVNGKPLYWYAREGKLDTIRIPEKTVSIYSMTCTDITVISKNELQQQIHSRIAPVIGEFRQQEIIKNWDTILKEYEIPEFPIAHLTISCSSGTYMRAIAQTLGEYLNCPALAFTITRTQVGQYSLSL